MTLANKQSQFLVRASGDRRPLLFQLLNAPLRVKPVGFRHRLLRFSAAGKDEISKRHCQAHRDGDQAAEEKAPSPFRRGLTLRWGFWIFAVSHATRSLHVADTSVYCLVTPNYNRPG